MADPNPLTPPSFRKGCATLLPLPRVRDPGGDGVPQRRPPPQGLQPPHPLREALARVFFLRYTPSPQRLLKKHEEGLNRLMSWFSICSSPPPPINWTPRLFATELDHTWQWTLGPNVWRGGRTVPFFPRVEDLKEGSGPGLVPSPSPPASPLAPRVP